jgi:tRNA modification GTPase
MLDDTIAAVATPPGTGGLGVVRVSGPGALAAADAVFRGATSLARAPSHTLHHGRLFDGDDPVDDAVAAVFRAPRSYTGEDVVELSCHGGTFLQRRVLDLCLRAGARLAGPGEFTRRAYLNGKMDLAQAEAVSELIAAHSDSYRRLALEQLEGRLSAYLDALHGGVLDLLARLEANLDFAEEEVPDLPRPGLVSRLDGLLDRARRLLDTAPRGRLLRDGLRAVLVGKPNAGKSSLFNALLDADRAIVTDVPGTTRDLLEERVLIDGVPVALADTAGLRPSGDPVEAEGMARARRALDRADVAVLVLDLTRPVTDDDRAALALASARPLVAVLNKCDASAPAAADAFRPLLNGTTTLRTSAVTGEGLDDLRRALLRGAAAPEAEPSPVPTLINARHEALLRDAAESLARARDAAAAGEPEECLCVDLRRTLSRVNEVVGRDAPDEVLDAVFSTFCIGK